ncbi:hypothetical protein [Streptomyces sp. URMC 123]|uniref:hypothetical protein n=1 Tax=Streptomyces sp. URMC 123 TaxID=3423403 RepID=UPI003F19B6E0
MPMWAACLWGLGGAGAVEALALIGAIRRVGGFPWQVEGELGPGPYAVVVLLRLGVGVVAAAALGMSGQMGVVASAIAAGIAAPKLLEQLGQQALAASSLAAAPGQALTASETGCAGGPSKGES